MSQQLRNAKTLTEERERKKSATEQQDHENGMQRAIKMIEEAHKDNKNHVSTFSLPESVLTELNRNGYKAKRVPPGEHAAMGDGGAVDINWD